jgi:transcriptional regulator with XRE-family HTH domain
MSSVGSERVVSLLKNAIRLSNFTYRDVERQLGWRVGTITRLMRGGPGLKVEHLLSILHVIGFSPGRFFAAAFPLPPDARPIEDRLARMLEQLHAQPDPAEVARTGHPCHPSHPAHFSRPLNSAEPAGSLTRRASSGQEEIDEMVRTSLRRLLTADGSEPPGGKLNR